MSTDPELTVEITEQGGYSLVVPAGSIDFHTHPALDEHLARAIDPTGLAVIADMSGVTFCDSSGLAVFARARRRADARGVTMVIVGMPGRVERVFSVTGLDRAFCRRPGLRTAPHWLETGAGVPSAS
ncbi:STAS domain-containing protein [Actinomadura keratinilytica]|jgi:anti-sigma B factor antagonist|uniref:Anti-sigma factor antagonist n=1 Tax=Actinomadura keratinilytica TaxID=547461 RepID=A0ABP7Z9S9_9ACTN